MSIIHNQLALYGEIDEIVIRASTGEVEDGAAVVAAVERLLPGTTGFGQSGWYREIQRFLNRDEIRTRAEEEVRFPTVEQAVEGLSDLEALRGGRRVDHPLDSDPGLGFEEIRPYDPANDPVLARAGYAAFVLVKITSITGEPPIAELGTVLTTAIGAFSGRELVENQLAADALMEAVNLINDRDDWLRIAGDIVGDTAGIGAGKTFAESARPCFGSLENVGGQYSSTVTTDSTADDLSVAQIETLINPINWNQCSKFFCAMSKNTPNRNSNRWSRVREKVGAECNKYGLITDLIFFKVKDNATGSIYLNYDIDPERTDPGYVEVDNGYIWVSPLSGKDPTTPGVRIRTSKRERVNGLSPSATAALACLMGWADAGKEMLAGTARGIINKTIVPNPALKPFIPSKDDDPNEKD